MDRYFDEVKNLMAEIHVFTNEHLERIGEHRVRQYFFVMPERF